MITLFGTVAEEQVTILKDEGCNTNFMSKTFVNKKRHLLNVEKTFVEVNHSNSNSTEEAREMVINAETETGNHKYSYN